jgi:hypothetical protein
VPSGELNMNPTATAATVVAAAATGLTAGV